MPDEAQTPVDYRALLSDLGMSVITGGSPELDEQPAEQEAPESAAPPEGLPAESEATATDAPDSTDYRKRFEDLQPQLTKAQEQNAEVRRLVEAARAGDTEALDALGIPYEAPDDDDEFEDPEEKLRREFDELKNEHLTAKQQQEQAQFAEREAGYIGEQIAALEDKANFELGEESADFVIDRARAERGEGGRPEVEKAFNSFISALESDRERYMKSKNDAPKAPVGGPGEEKIDLSNDEERRAAIVRDMEAEEGSD